jgi:hypothetical protein
MLAGAADSVIDVLAIVTVKLAVLTVVPVWLPSPEYVAVTGYRPGISDVGVAQLNAGSVVAQSVDPPEVKVTVPVAPAGSPATETVSLVPYGMLAGAAASVIDVLALVMVKLAPVAVALV